MRRRTLCPVLGWLFPRLLLPGLLLFAGCHNPSLEEVWEQSFGDYLDAPAIGPDGTLYTANLNPWTGDGQVLAIDPETPEVLWSAPVSFKTGPLMVRSDGVVMVVANGWLVALDAAGMETWTRDLPDSPM